MTEQSSTGNLGRGGTKVQGRYEEFIKYLELEADYLENVDPVRYADMIQKRRTEAQRTKEKMRT